MLKLKDFLDRVQNSGEASLEDGQFIVGGADGDHTETGEDTVNCDYYATYDDGENECWRLDENCCDPA